MNDIRFICVQDIPEYSLFLRGWLKMSSKHKELCSNHIVKKCPSRHDMKLDDIKLWQEKKKNSGFVL